MRVASSEASRGVGAEVERSLDVSVDEDICVLDFNLLMVEENAGAAIPACNKQEDADSQQDSLI